MTLRALIVGPVLGWIVMSLALPAFAAEIYRCGPRGATYSQTPCADGHRLAVADERNEEQRAQAQQTAARTLAMATTLESDRLAIEAAHRPALAGSLSTRLKQIQAQARIRAVDRASQGNPPARCPPGANPRLTVRLTTNSANQSAADGSDGAGVTPTAAGAPQVAAGTVAAACNRRYFAHNDSFDST